MKQRNRERKSKRKDIKDSEITSLLKGPKTRWNKSFL